MAVVIGVILGIAGAVYLSNTQTGTSTTFKSLTTTTQQITPKLTQTANVGFAQYSELPKNEMLTFANSVKISGKANNSLSLFSANELSIEHIPVKKGTFSKEVTLKPGRNNIALFENSLSQERTKVLKVFHYRKPATKPKLLSITDKIDATSEASILESKLEQKVIELRDKPIKVYSGKVVSLSEKELLLKTNNQTQKIMLEPEITNFFEVDDKDLNPIALSDVEKGETVTAFVSNIGGEEKSYTIYREPNTFLVVGKVSNINSSTYRLTIINYDKTTFDADIETTSVQTHYNKELSVIEKFGFSKLEIGQRIVALLYPSGTANSIQEYLIIHK